MLSTRSASKAIIAWGTVLLWGSNAIAPAVAFAPNCGTASPATISSSKQWHVSQPSKPNKVAAQLTLTALFQSNNNDDDPITDNQLLQRFLSPRIDDNGLPLTDVLIAQIVAPTFQIYWLALTHAPNPTWARPISTYFGEALELAPRGSLLAPTLIHGAGLAVCWLAGALAAKSFEKEAFILKEVEGRGVLDAFGRWDTILLRLFQAGAFASGILIVSTQTDLLLEFGRNVQFGESDETDRRLLVAAVEVINDIFWEALVIGSWRIIHANFMSSPDYDERSRRRF